MALNYWRSSGHTSSENTTKRNFAKALVGDFALNLEREQYHTRAFLPRNMTRILAYHEKQRMREAQPDGSIRRTSSRNSARNNAPATNGVHEVVNDTPSLTSGESSFHSPSSKRISGTPESPLQMSRPVSSENSTGSKATGRADPGQRRSLRHQLGKQHEEDDAQLVIFLKNARKKLNFKENRPSDGQPPRKRQRRDVIKCHVHLCIWNNSPGLDRSDPIIRKTELCEVLPPDSITDSPSGIYVGIRMEKPLVISSKEMKIPIEEKNGTRLGFATNYFMELKIIPLRSDVVDWPPVPLLGKSEGDQTTGLSMLAAEKLQGALIARYQHLPQAPEPETPLGLFYLHDGRTYRTKYGMEVASQWTRLDPLALVKEEPAEEVADDAESWTMDDLGRPFGRDATPPKKIEETKLPTQISPPRITYYIDPAKAKGTPKDFRKFLVKGYKCPMCASGQFKNLETLHFHMTTSHHKYRYVIDEQKFDPLGGNLTSATLKVESIDVPRPRNYGLGKMDNDDWSWTAPDQPFDIQRHSEGDLGWLGIQNKKKIGSITPLAPAKPDSLSELRKDSGGFLPEKHVPTFRKDQRRMYPNIRLRTLTEAQSIPYTSISHRQVQLNEDNRSETDDEMDNEWFVEKHLENLDATAREEQWTTQERHLRKKWTRHLFTEQQPHSRYLSDSLIRFVKAELNWLADGDAQLKLAFADMLEEMKEKKVINRVVIEDIWGLLAAGISRPKPATEITDVLPEQTDEGSMESRCSICQGMITDGRRRAVRCTNLKCETSGKWYHGKCVGCEYAQRYNWKCDVCQKKKDKQQAE